jgi:hypothetical protein
VLQTFPGVFTGIGEITIHKEFVSSKISGETASLTNPALDRLLDFAAEAGLVVLIHSDVDVPFPKEGAEPVYLAQMKDLFNRHTNVSISWAHCGVGRIIHPIKGHTAMLEAILRDPATKNINFDISWDEVAKYIVSTPESLRVSADMIITQIAFSLAQTKSFLQTRKSISASTTCTNYCGRRFLRRRALKSAS